VSRAASPGFDKTVNSIPGRFFSSAPELRNVQRFLREQAINHVAKPEDRSSRLASSTEIVSLKRFRQIRLGLTDGPAKHVRMAGNRVCQGAIADFSIVIAGKARIVWRRVTIATGRGDSST
jgi:hypothetical protein